MDAIRHKINKQPHFSRQKHGVFHTAIPIVQVIVWGTERIVSEYYRQEKKKILMADDFKAFSRTSVDDQYTDRGVVPNQFKFKDYCPAVFRDLRQRFKVDIDDYIKSVCGGEVTESQSPGRSNATFYTTHDHRFVFKTIGKEEVALFLRILTKYHEHIVHHNDVTLLPQYVALHRITIKGTETYIVAMRSIFSHNLPMHEKYDLKGSTYNRKASSSEKLKENPTLKDGDFISLDRKLFVGDEEKARLLKILEYDVHDFCAKCNLMDYSLLVGIHHIEDWTDEELAELGEDEEMPSFVPEVDVYGLRSKEKAEIYFVGMIDVLTKYNAKKNAAHAAKTIKLGKEKGAEISTVNPKKYSQRFIEFVQKTLA